MEPGQISVPEHHNAYDSFECAINLGPAAEFGARQTRWARAISTMCPAELMASGQRNEAPASQYLGTSFARSLYCGL